MKNIICRYVFLQEGNTDVIFLRRNLYPFWTLAKIILCNSDETDFLFYCPSLMLEIAIRCIQAMLERGGIRAFSLFLSFCFSLTSMSTNYCLDPLNYLFDTKTWKIDFLELSWIKSNVMELTMTIIQNNVYWIGF